MKKEEGTSGGGKWRGKGREEDCGGNGNPDHKYRGDVEADGGKEGREAGNILS